MSLGALALLQACAAAGQGTVRVVDGQALVQRDVSEEAYAQYVRAAQLEHAGELTAAVEAYRTALASDPRSVEIQTRIAAVECRRGGPAALSWFSAASARDPAYEPLWRELAICRLSRGELEPARAAAQRAVHLDPDRPEASVAFARILAAQGKREEARRWLVALLTRDELAATAADARAALGRLGVDADALFPRTNTPRAPRARPATPEVDRAVLTEDIVLARALAGAAAVPPAELALRAAALGRVEIARAQAGLVLDAHPDSGSAWVAALLAADLGRDIGELERVALELGSDPEAPSPLAARLFAELLARQVGDDARGAWVSARGSLPPPEEPLERAVEER